VEQSAVPKVKVSGMDEPHLEDGPRRLWSLNRALRQVTLCVGILTFARKYLV
jgi:hypothetical protein